jgi:hypothetical protein
MIQVRVEDGQQVWMLQAPQDPGFADQALPPQVTVFTMLQSQMRTIGQAHDLNDPAHAAPADQSDHLVSVIDHGTGVEENGATLILSFPGPGWRWNLLCLCGTMSHEKAPEKPFPTITSKRRAPAIVIFHDTRVM